MPNTPLDSSPYVERYQCTRLHQLQYDVESVQKGKSIFFFGMGKKTRSRATRRRLQSFFPSLRRACTHQTRAGARKRRSGLLLLALPGSRRRLYSVHPPLATRAASSRAPYLLLLLLLLVVMVLVVVLVVLMLVVLLPTGIAACNSLAGIGFVARIPLAIVDFVTRVSLPTTGIGFVTRVSLPIDFVSRWFLSLHVVSPAWCTGGAAGPSVK